MRQRKMSVSMDSMIICQLDREEEWREGNRVSIKILPSCLLTYVMKFLCVPGLCRVEESTKSWGVDFEELWAGMTACLTPESVSDKHESWRLCLPSSSLSMIRGSNPNQAQVTTPQDACLLRYCKKEFKNYDFAVLKAHRQKYKFVQKMWATAVSRSTVDVTVATQFAAMLCTSFKKAIEKDTTFCCGVCTSCLSGNVYTHVPVYPALREFIVGRAEQSDLPAAAKRLISTLLIGQSTSMLSSCDVRGQSCEAENWFSLFGLSNNQVVFEWAWMYGETPRWGASTPNQPMIACGTLSARQVLLDWDNDGPTSVDRGGGLVGLSPVPSSGIRLLKYSILPEQNEVMTRPSPWAMKSLREVLGLTENMLSSNDLLRSLLLCVGQSFGQDIRIAGEDGPVPSCEPDSWITACREGISWEENKGAVWYPSNMTLPAFPKRSFTN